jgi:two-component system sensor histidine kinase KdpD
LKRHFSSRLWGYALGVGIVMITTLVGELIKMAAIVDPTNMDMLYVLGVVISNIYLGFGVSLMVSLLGVLAFDFFFLPPLYTFAVANQQETINLLILVVVSLVISLLSNRVMRL